MLNKNPALRVYCLFLVLICQFIFSPGMSAEKTQTDFSSFAQCGSTGGRYGEFRFKMKWDPGSGQSLMVADKDRRSQCIIRLKNSSGGVIFTGEKGPAVPGLEINPVNPFPDKQADSIECVLKLQQHLWSVYLGGREIFRIPPVFAADSLWLSEQTAGTVGKIRFQKTAPVYFHDDFMVADKDANQLDSWDILGGKWQIHTVLESAVEQKTSPNLKSRPVEMERSPNFYSLKGTGEPGLIVSGYYFNDNYIMQAAIQLQKGESGLAFYVQDESNYHTFTIYIADNGESYALLKRHQSGKQPLVMRAVQLNLLADQWVMPKVQIENNHITAYVDNIKVIETDEMLPPGGQFGLFVNSAQEMVFDDVTAESLPGLKLDEIPEIKFNTVFCKGDVFYRPGIFDWLFGKGREKEIFPGSSDEDRMVVVGSPEDKVAVAGMTMKLKNSSAVSGLIFGWKGKDSPFFRYLYIQSGMKRYVRLDRIRSENAEPEILETAELAGPAGTADVSLRAELYPDGRMKLFCNGRLQIVRRESSPVEGAAGAYAMKYSEVSVDGLVCRFKPLDVFRDRREKNEIFENDPYMRNWANPAGQWIKDEKENGYWHKSDFLGAFSLSVPVTDNSEIHLGAGDEKPAGEICIRSSGPDFEIAEVATGRPILRKAKAELFKKDKEGKDLSAFRVSAEDSLLYGESEDDLLFVVNLKQPLSGTRIFIRGFADSNLLALRAVRDNVLDFLFNEAPYEWTRNGGNWQIINRFQCDPRWSHMNGQSSDDLASLWSKYQIEGDFCIEMYAGMRHGDWYQRVGDLNLTVLNKKEMPSDGYTFICSGWDPDHSQTRSRLLREGKPLEESDKYLTPRWRDGNVRKYFDTLLGRDRDVHGAWYYLKARRVGDLVEYYFDDIKVFSVRDKEPLGKGGFGIWTFMNSMMVARVKVAAAKITPKEISFAEVSPDKVPLMKAGPAIADRNLLLNGLPADLMSPDSWQPADSAGAPRLTFSKNGFTVENILGAGKFAAEAKGLEFPESSISAWTCEVKRTENAEFNFHFELGSRNAKGEYRTLQRYFHQISGTDYSKDIYQFAGTTGEIKPVKFQQFTSEDGWTRVWFPLPNIISKFGSSKEFVWKVTGFGNFQPSDILQGLKGNGPGEAYAIRNFSPVYSRAPVVSCKVPVKDACIYKFKVDGKESAAGTLDELNKGLKAIAKQGIVYCSLSASPGTENAELVWAMPEDEGRWTCRWDGEKQNSIIITTDANYRYLNNERLSVKVQGTDLPVEDLGINKFRISLLDRMDESFRKLLQGDSIEIEILKGGKSRKVTLAWKDCPLLAPPVLAKLDGITPFFQSFENSELRKRLQLDPNRMAFVWDRERSSICLAVANRMSNQRLRADFVADLSSAKFPIVQFMYKTDPMGQISLNLRDSTYVYLDEPHLDARKVRYGQELSRDGKWHSWTGFATDAFDKNRYLPSIFRVQRLTFGSFYKEDQTGRNSQLFLDDVVFGPAVREAEQLAFTPSYYDIKDGVRVFTAVLPGEKSFFELGPSPRNKISWKEIPNSARHVPELWNAKDGVNQILLKAVSADARESLVTSLPFLLDMMPKTANFAFKTSDEPSYNGSYLQIEFQNRNGAPINLDSLATAFAGAKIDIDRQLSRIEHRQDADIVNVNWPYMLRGPIDKMQDGETKELVFSGIEDGAGNKAPDLHVPIRINYAEDKLPPTFLRPFLPDNILFHLDFSCDSYDKLPVNLQNANSKVMKEGSTAFVRFSGSNGAGTISVISKKRRNSNDIDFDSYMAIRLRFPHAEVPASASLVLDLKYSDNKAVQLNLLDGKIPDNIKIDKSLDIRKRDWQDFVVDLEELYTRKFGDKDDRRKLRIREVNLVARDLNPKDLFDLTLFTIFKEYASDDKFTIDAYDQSGISDMNWELDDSEGNPAVNGVCDGRTFELKALEPADGVRWLKFIVGDKAGNKTSPLVFPVIFNGTHEKAEQKNK